MTKGLLIGWLCVLPILTSLRVPIWANNLMLWESAVQVSPLRARAWVNYAVVLSEHDRWADTEHALREAIRVGSDPTVHQDAQRALVVSLAWQNLGAIASDHGDYTGAAAAYEQAVAAWPSGVWNAPLRVGMPLQTMTTTKGKPFSLPKTPDAVRAEPR